jgi:protein-tyrosine phosphatase
LFRSAHLDAATTQDIALLHRLGVHLVVDLRDWTNERERSAARPRLSAEVETLNLPMSSDLAEVRRLLLDPSVDGIGGFYLAMATADRHQIVAALRAIASACHAPVWIHCTSGKDRTGIVAAILLGLLGADREAIVSDYARTVVDPAALEEALDRAGWDTQGLPSASFRADPASMYGFLTQLESVHGSLEGWAIESGLEDRYVARLREHLLAS